MGVEQAASSSVKEKCRVPFDPRMLQRMGSRAWAEQGPNPLAFWGGASGYKALAKLPTNERLTYAAVKEGYSSEMDIASITGLDLASVRSGVAGLTQRGLVATKEEVEVAVK